MHFHAIISHDIILSYHIIISYYHIILSYHIIISYYDISYDISYDIFLSQVLEAFQHKLIITLSSLLESAWRGAGHSGDAWGRASGRTETFRGFPRSR